MTLSEATTKGLEMGFTQARNHPEQTLEEFMQQVTVFRGQVKALPDWKLRLLAGKGTFFDRARMYWWARNDC